MDTVRFRVNNLTTEIVDHVDACLQKRLELVSSAQKEKRWFNRAVRQGRWDGWTRFYNIAKRTFPTGLLPAIITELGTEWQVEIIDERRPPSLRRKAGDTDRLRDYQGEDLAACLTTFCHGIWWPRGYTNLPTATGKTYVINAVSSLVAGNVLLLVPSVPLLRQNARRLSEALGERVGIVGDSELEVCRVTVATPHTLIPHRKEFKKWFLSLDGLLVDEVHRFASSTSFYKLLKLIPAYIRLGFSATPRDKDSALQQLRLHSYVGPELYYKAPKEMEERGVIAPVEVQYALIARPNLLRDSAGRMTVPTWDMTYRDAYEHLIVKNAHRNQRIVDWVKQSDEPTLILTEILEHGRRLSSALNCPFVSGEDSTERREDLLEQLRTRKLRCLVANRVFNEGVDIPAVRRVVLACGGRKESRYIQQIGRGRRKESPDDTLTVLDFLDATNEHLNTHSRERLDVSVRMGFTITTLDELPKFDKAENA